MAILCQAMVDFWIRFDSLLLAIPAVWLYVYFLIIIYLLPHTSNIHDLKPSFSYICRMTIHKEGYSSIAWATILFGVINILSFYFISYWSPALSWVIFIGTLDLIIISNFFFPHSKKTIDHQAIIPLLLLLMVK